MLVITFLAFNWVKNRLDESYSASNHPVDYATGQTGFSGQEVKSYYQIMRDAGTLDIYWQTQLIDFGFIAAIFILGMLIGGLCYRLTASVWAQRAALMGGLAIMLGAISDAIENLISFVMLANATNFANWIAIAYSSFAVAKFALITLGMVLIIVSILLGAIGFLSRRGWADERN